MRALSPGKERAELLAALADRLTGQARADVLAEALKAARQGWNKYGRAQALAVVADRLAGEAREAALRKALDTTLARAKMYKNRDFGGYEHVRTLSELAGRLPEPLAIEALEQARSAWQAGDRAGLLVALADRLSGQARLDALADALRTAFTMSITTKGGWRTPSWSAYRTARMTAPGW